MIDQNLDYAIPCFYYANSLSYIANKIGDIHVPVVFGKSKGISYAACTSGEWGIRLRHVSEYKFRLDVVSLSKETIERVASIKPAVRPNGQFCSLMSLFASTAEFCDTDINTIPFLQELYYDFPIREMFCVLNESCKHSLDGLDADLRRPSNIVITASARQFLSSRKEQDCDKSLERIS